MKTKKSFVLDKNFKLKEGVITRKNADSDNLAQSLALAKYTSLGYYLLTPLLGGVFLGLLIDKYLYVAPFGVVGGIILGSIATFYNLIKFTKES